MNSPRPSRFLDLRALAALQHLRFTPRQRAEAVYSGRHRSRRQGGAGEFADFREYVEGEDLKRLDWKVLARTGRAYTRLHEDETRLVCQIVLDTSASMHFGSGGTKLEYAQYLATAFSQVIGWQQDQVGLALVAEALDTFVPPAGTPGHLSHLQSLLEKVQPQP